jgi:hypothetical protein
MNSTVRNRGQEDSVMLSVNQTVESRFCPGIMTARAWAIKRICRRSKLEFQL